MDLARLVEIFKCTIDPQRRREAEAQLEILYKMNSFVPLVLQLVMNNEVEMAVRQAAAIYLKNTISAYWSNENHGSTNTDENTFQIADQDQIIIRESIVDAIVIAPDLISSHLSVCLSNIIRNDFPAKWTGIVDKINYYLQMPDKNCWMGAFIALCQLVKFFEYKTADDRKPMDDAMSMLLPLIYQRCAQLVEQDTSDQSVLIQKQILKVFYGFMQYSFPLKLLTNDVFTQWMELFRRIVERPIPEEVNQIDIDDRAQNCHWKCKKWALHILSRVFDRYGSPKSVSKEFKEFADWYIKTFSNGIIQVCLKVLEQQGNKNYVAPRVLQQTLNYLTIAVNHAITWKLIKPHMNPIIENILFPLLCYTEEDAKLWELDPQEYIRMKFDVFEDYVSPVTAAQNLLHKCCKRRKDMLLKVIQFSVQILNSNESTPPMKDGALHMIGSVADILLKKDSYKSQLESMLVTYVFPFFQNPNGYLRARACCVLRYFSDTEFQNENNLFQAYQAVYRCLTSDDQLPVKVEAAICLQYLMSNQERVLKLIEQNITQIALELLNIIRETENEDLTNVMQKLICTFPKQLSPTAFEMTQHLEQTFNQLIDSYTEDATDDKALTALGVLNTIDTILSLLEDQVEIMQKIEPIVIRLIVKIFTTELIDLYEEASTLVCTVTSTYISDDMWKMFELLYQVFKKDGFDCFTDMMPALHNFITVNPQAFISKQDYVLAIYDMCKTVLENGDAGEDAECHAAKLIECVILQFKGQIDNCIEPFIRLALTRLSKKIETTELKTMCLQILIASLYYNEQLFMEILNKSLLPDSPQTFFTEFVQQWIKTVSSFIGLHDRKICVLGLIKLITLPPNLKHPIIDQMYDKFLPSILTLFEGLKTAYEAKASSEQADSDDEVDYESGSDDFEDLDDDEDQRQGKLSGRNLGDLFKKIDANSMFEVTSAEYEEDEDDEYNPDDEYDQTALESYSTFIDTEECPDDEYIIFKDVMEGLQQRDPLWYNQLVSVLNEEQKRNLSDVFVLALQRKAAAESRQIEKSGGYNFTLSQNVPSNFNFSNI